MPDLIEDLPLRVSMRLIFHHLVDAEKKGLPYRFFIRDVAQCTWKSHTECGLNDGRGDRYTVNGPQ